MAVVAGLLAAPAAARAADVKIAEIPSDTKLDALGDRIVWSAPGSTSGRWRLVEHTASGPRSLRVAPAGSPFDVDLGRDRRGRIVAVYSRCRREEALSRRRCDVYRYDFDAGREVAVAKINTAEYDEVEPAISGSWIAFVRRGRGGERLLIRDLRAGHRTLRLRVSAAGKSPVDLDLRGRSVAVEWAREWSTSVGLAFPHQRGRAVLNTPGSGGAAQVYGTAHPTFAGDRMLYWGLQSSHPDYGEIWRRDLDSGRNERATARIPKELRLFAQDGAASYYAVDTGGLGSPLELHRVDGLRFEPAPKLTLDED